MAEKADTWKTCAQLFVIADRPTNINDLVDALRSEDGGDYVRADMFADATVAEQCAAQDFNSSDGGFVLEYVLKRVTKVKLAKAPIARTDVYADADADALTEPSPANTHPTLTVKCDWRKYTCEAVPVVFKNGHKGVKLNMTVREKGVEHTGVFAVADNGRVFTPDQVASVFPLPSSTARVRVAKGKVNALELFEDAKSKRPYGRVLDTAPDGVCDGSFFFEYNGKTLREFCYSTTRKKWERWNHPSGDYKGRNGL